MNLIVTMPGGSARRQWSPWGDYLNPITAKLLGYGMAIGADVGPDCDNVARTPRRLAFNVAGAMGALAGRLADSRKAVQETTGRGQVSARLQVAYLTAALESLAGPGGDGSDGSHDPALWGNPDFPGHF